MSCMPWRPLSKKAAVNADMVWRLLLTHKKHSAKHSVASIKCHNVATFGFRDSITPPGFRRT
jgi:hypothetical protein